MIVVMAFVSVFLHSETDQIARKTPNFLASNWEFLGEIGKKEDILDWEWGQILDPGEREKRPCPVYSLPLLSPPNVPNVFNKINNT